MKGFRKLGEPLFAQGLTARLRLGTRMTAGGDSWQDVSVPDASFNWVPFTIQQSGRTFRPATNWNIRTHANITVAKTYYLNTVTGLDANSGLTSLLPKKTWNNIIGLGDYDRIIIQNGSYLIRSESSLAPSRSCEVIGEGTIYFTSDRGNNLGAWSLAGGQVFTYQSTVAGGQFISRVDDESSLDAFGIPNTYASKTSVAQVEAQAGSFYWVGGVLYVHTFDGLTPSGRTDIKYYDSIAMQVTADSITLYWENINFRGGLTMRNSSATGNLKAYFKSCTGFVLSGPGVTELISQDCSFFKATGDGINYDLRNTVVTKAIEIDCEIYDLGLASSDQASTSHNGCLTVRINGKYHHTAGQNIATAQTTTYEWLLGSELYNSTTGIGLVAAGKTWLDSCTIHDNATNDLQNSVGSTIYIRNLVSGGNNSIAGTLTTY